MKILLVCISLLLPLISIRGATDTLDIYVIDTEGGKAMIVVPPGGETMLVDAGYPTANERDTNRIVAAAQALWIKQFNYIVATHYDADHAGNVPNLAAKIPGKVYIDHGEVVATANDRNKTQFYEPYVKFVADKKRTIVKPGDTIPLKGVQITVVSAGGEAITKPMPGAGQPNPLAVDVKPEPVDVYDNAGSIGLLYQFGKFRMLDLADLLQMVECKLMAPNNQIGTVDLWMVSHHGFRVSNSRLLIHSIRPKVAIMNNGSRKGCELQVLDNIKTSPGLQDLWQMHYTPASADKNTAENLIANPKDPCEAKMIKVSAQLDGTFTVTNTRNDFSRTYKP
jgi:competence protein ComEC